MTDKRSCATLITAARIAGAACACVTMTRAGTREDHAMATMIAQDTTSLDGIAAALGDQRDLLGYRAKVAAEALHLPGPDFVDRVFAVSDRSPQVLRGLQQIYQTGRLGGSGYLSILPVDQGIEHSAGASFATN